MLDADLPPVLLTRDLIDRGGRAQAYRRAAAGELVRISPGAYVASTSWGELGYDLRHLVAMHTLSERRPDVVFSHRSAAIAWSLPLVGPAARRPEVMVRPGGTDRSDQSSILHRTSVDFEVATVGGLRVTSMARTLLDVARRCPAQVSVPMLDHSLRKGVVNRNQLDEELRRGTHVGRRRAAFALAFADPKAESPGESFSRVELDCLGMPRPEMQIEFRDRRGRIGFVDFWWPSLNLIGEFDGLGKYLREELRGDRTIAEVIVDEKRREDRLRATTTHPHVARWEWDDVRNPALLRGILAAALGSEAPGF